MKGSNDLIYDNIRGSRRYLQAKGVLGKFKLKEVSSRSWEKSLLQNLESSLRELRVWSLTRDRVFTGDDD